MTKQPRFEEEVQKSFSDYLADHRPFRDILQGQVEVNSTQAELLGKILADFDGNQISPLLESLQEVLEVALFEELIQQLGTPNQQINYQTLSYAGFGNGLPDTQEIVSFRLSSDYRSIQEQIRGIYQDDKGKYHLNSILFARFIKAKYPLVTTADGTFYILRKSVYEKQTKLQVSSLVSKEIKDFVSGLWNQSRQNDYLEAIKQETLIDENQKEQERKKYLNFPNGYLNLDTLEFHTESPEELFFTTQQSYEYDSEATCPLFHEAIDSIFCGDKQLIKVFQQLFGYLLTNEQKIQLGFFFLGSGSNGKSLLIKVMTAIIGQSYVTNTSLKKLSSRFGYSDLLDKKVMFSTENEMSNFSDTEHFKALTGGDCVLAEQKNKDPITIQLNTKVIVALNGMPNTSDTSEGFFRRVFIIPFLQHYLPPVPVAEQDPDKEYMDVELENKLMRELPGILNFALEGLQGLRANNYVLPTCKACEQAREQYRLQQMPIPAFFEQVFQKDPAAKFHRPQLVHAYKEWRESKDFSPKDYSRTDLQKEFQKHLADQNLLVEAKKIQGRYYYQGITKKEK